jgi:hypothetical protein
MRYSSILRTMAMQALRHPRLIGDMLRTAWVFRAANWYRRAPFLPLPPAEYVAWRLDTAYGSSAVAPRARDLENYLRWAVAMRRGRGKEA